MKQTNYQKIENIIILQNPITYSNKLWANNFVKLALN